MKALALCFLLLACCGPPKTIPTNQPVRNEFYAYVKVSDAIFHVIVRQERYLDMVLKEIGCGQQIVCLVHREGEFFIVEQRK